MVMAVLVMLPASASAYDVKLKRYPYLTDLVGSSVIVNWATDLSAQSAVVKWGQVGSESCTANTTTATRTFIFVNGVSEYQWKAQLTGLAPDAAYCYRVYFGASPQTDLLDSDPSPTFRTQVPAGSPEPFKFAVFADWTQVDDPSGQNPHQSNVIAQVAASGARFAIAAGDNAPQTGSQKNYGDLYQTGANTSVVFGPSFWKVAGASLPLFPTLGNHDHNNSTMLVNWPQDTAVSTSGGRYTTDTYCCLNGTESAEYPSAWYAFDAGLARFYVLDAAWQNSNVGSANLYKNDYDYHWAPGTPQYEWLANDLAAHPRALKFAFFHFPMYSDQSSNSSDTYLQGASSLEGLLKQHEVTAAFSGHSHNYQRNSAPPGGIPTHVTGGGGGNLESIGIGGCSALNVFGIGWSNQRDVGSACGSAPVPEAKDRVHHFLLVSVNGTSVTVTPTDELGRTFDPVTYNTAGIESDLKLTSTDAPDPVLVGGRVTYTHTVENTGPSTATGVSLSDTLPAGVTFESATSSQGACSELAGMVTCALGVLANGASANVEIEVTPQAAGTITNQASVTSTLNDPDPEDNTTSTETTVDPVADLSITQSDDPDPVVSGELLTYTLTVQNAGPQSATGVQLIDDLPPGVAFESATPSQGSCSQSSGTVECALGTVDAEQSATVQIEVRPQSTGLITNEAGVASDAHDPDPSDNVTSADTTVEQDSTAPAAPALTDTDPVSPANDNSPKVKGSAESGSTVTLYTSSDCSGAAAATGSDADFATPGITASVADDSTTTFYATARDATGNTSTCSVTSATFVEDSTAPNQPALTNSDPVSPANDNSPEVKGSAESGSTVSLYTTADCAESPVATGPADDFASAGFTASVPDDSPTTFRATATDTAGNTSACSTDSFTYVEDSTAPAPPTLTDTDPASPANDNFLGVRGSAESGSTVSLYTELGLLGRGRRNRLRRRLHHAGHPGRGRRRLDHDLPRHRS